MHRPSWIGSFVAAALIAPHAAAQFEAVRTPAGAQVRWLAGGAVHSTSARIADLYAFGVAGTPAVGATWSEARDGELPRHFYLLSLDGVSVATLRETSYQLALRRAAFDPAGGAPTFPGAPQGAGGNVHIVQYRTQPLLAYSSAITALGGEVFDFIENHAHIVRMDGATRAQVARLAFVRAIVEYQPEFRVDPQTIDELSAGALSSPRRFNVQVFRRGLAEQDVVAAEIARLGGTVHALVPEGFRMEATLSAELLLHIATLDEVRFIDPWSAPEDDMDIVRSFGGANHVETVAGLTGQGVRVEVLDGGCDVGHPDFASPLVHGGVSAGTHGTCTSGIVAGTGAGNAAARGMLPSAQLVVADYSGMSGGNRYTHTAELVDTGLNYQCVLQSNSWGSNLTTSYTTISAELDDIIVSDDFIILQSQSNNGNQLSRPEAWAKNIVSIGGINHQNTLTTADDSWGGASIGPAADGRMKPDLAYFYDSVLCTDQVGSAGYTSNNYYSGFGGTSAATPISAGHFGLFFQMWHAGAFGNTPGAVSVFASRPHFTLAKAAMINTASAWAFSGAAHNLSRAKQGFGHADVAQLYDRRAKTFFVDQTDVLVNLGVRNYNLNVAGGEPDLRVTLVYRDAPGAVTSSQHRKNDLTLVVTSPAGTVYYGNNGLSAGLWSTAGGSPNTRDTVENVFVPDPMAGTWLVAVRGDNINTDPATNLPASSTDFALWATPITAGPVCAQPIPYCVAKLTSAFFLPAIGYSGTPAQASGDFEITLANALPDKSAIAVYGAFSASTPFHNGVLCAQQPLVRSPLTTTDAAGSASSAIAIDAAMVGTTRYYQWWFRDPPDAFSDGLSNALQVTFCP